MREELFEAIRMRLSRLFLMESGEYEVIEDGGDERPRKAAVVHVDLWNHNVEFMEQEDAWGRPAVFVEFGPIVWEPFKNGYYRGAGTVTIHTVTDWMEEKYDRAFALCDAVTAALDGLDGVYFAGFSLRQTHTNHNHEDILENLDTFSVKYLKEL